MRQIFTSLFLLLVVSGFSVNTWGQSPSREEVLKQIEDKRAELQKLEKQFLAPSKEDCATYAEFLRQRDTGLIRLLPRETYESDTYQSKNKKTLTVRGGGSYYSFTRLSHEYDYGTDIGLEQGYLKVAFAGADYGMLTNLGDVPLEEVTVENESVSFLSEYKAATEEPQARSEYRKFANGTTVNDSLYTTRLPVTVNTTYLLRSISYDTSDVLVALRVIRKDADDSLIIAWKLLKKNPKPALARNKTEQ